MFTTGQASTTDLTPEQLAPEQPTAEQKWLVQTSWHKVVPMAAHVAELFYDRLFELDPLLEDLFPANLSEQGTQLMRALGLAVERLDDPGSLAASLEELGQRHADYGVRPGHYVTMGSALLWTLEQSLAEDFTRRVKEAWGAVYQVVATQLIEVADAAAALGREPGSARRSVESVALGTRRVG